MHPRMAPHAPVSDNELFTLDRRAVGKRAVAAEREADRADAEIERGRKEERPMPWRSPDDGMALGYFRAWAKLWRELHDELTDVPAQRVGDLAPARRDHWSARLGSNAPLPSPLASGRNLEPEPLVQEHIRTSRHPPPKARRRGV